MFRPTKSKRKKARIVTTRDDDDSSQEDDTEIVKRPVKKKAKTPKKSKRKSHTTMSFDVEEEPTKRKRKKRGMGYGGATMQEEHEPKEGEEDAGREPDLYGKEALEALKSQQKYKQKEKATEPTTESATGTMPEKKDGESTTLPSHIPLNSKQEEPVILTGEEAISFNGDNDTSKRVEEPQPFLVPDKDTQDREDHVARRAGIRTKATPASKASSLDELKQQVQSTLQHLQNQQNDIQQAHDVRLVELEQTQTELGRQETELNQAGKSLEYYQQLRLALASWVGALRELQSKVQPVQQALLDLDVEISNPSRWQEWQRDVVAVLSQAHLLGRVLGKQVQDTMQEEQAQVDEFGRDVKSQQTLQREQRARQRRLVRQEWEERHNNNNSLLEEYYSNANFTSSEARDLEERRTALLEALRVAMREISEEYTSTSSLFGVFAEWQRAHPDEYKQCFASLSLADLLGVLIRVDLCSDMNPLYYGEKDGKPRIAWLQLLKQASRQERDESGSPDDSTPVQLVLDKILVAAVHDILEKGAYNIFSTKQTQALSSFCQFLFDLSVPTSRSTSRLKVRVMQYIRECIDSLSIPILVKLDDSTDVNQDDELLQEAVEFATQGQVYRLKNLLVNILRYWAPLVDDDRFCEAVLDFLSSHFLFVLSSLQQRRLTDTSSNIFGQVWKALQETKWLDRPQVMLQTAPLRAAAVAFGQV